MALDKAELREMLIDKMGGKPDNKEDAFESLADALVEYFKNNLEVDIPVGAITGSVTGGSGAPAVGIPNKDPIKCTVK